LALLQELLLQEQILQVLLVLLIEKLLLQHLLLLVAELLQLKLLTEASELHTHRQRIKATLHGCRALAQKHKKQTI